VDYGKLAILTGALPENPCLSCVKIFAVRFFRAHGKELICRAFFIERTAKKKRTTNKLFAVRSKKTHGKEIFLKKFELYAYNMLYIMLKFGRFL
jgi:hypothetical protein